MVASPPPSHLDSPRRLPRRPFFAGLVFSILAGTCFLALLPPSQTKRTMAPDVVRQDLAFRKGRWYRIGETNPFTGFMADYYPNGARLFRSAVSNGLLNGISEGWYPGGQIQIREFYKDSVSDGFRHKWYQNGQLMSEVMVTQGKLEGPFRSWHENGRLAERIELVQGQPEGEAWAFYGSGFAKARTRTLAGQILAQQSWEDGQYQPTTERNDDARHSELESGKVDRP